MKRQKEPRTKEEKTSGGRQGEEEQEEEEEEEGVDIYGVRGSLITVMTE